MRSSLLETDPNTNTHLRFRWIELCLQADELSLEFCSDIKSSDKKRSFNILMFS
jgi:hypothetical protein